MIDRTWQVAPSTIDAAAAGEADTLEASLRDHGATEDVIGWTLSAVREPDLVLEILRVAPGSMLRQRALLGARIGLLLADGDDREEVRPAVVAETPAELMHTLLAGLGFGPRVAHELEGLSQPITLERVEESLLAVRDGRALPEQVQPARASEAHRWWGLRWHEPAQPEAVARLQILDVGRLWIQDDHALIPADPVGVWLLLAPLLDAASRLGRQPVDARLLRGLVPAEPDVATGSETP